MLTKINTQMYCSMLVNALNVVNKWNLIVKLKKFFKCVCVCFKSIMLTKAAFIWLRAQK